MTPAAWLYQNYSASPQASSEVCEARKQPESFLSLKAGSFITKS